MLVSADITDAGGAQIAGWSRAPLFPPRDHPAPHPRTEGTAMALGIALIVIGVVLVLAGARRDRARTIDVYMSPEWLAAHTKAVSRRCGCDTCTGSSVQPACPASGGHHVRQNNDEGD